jgi:chemotaxis signal transduction protein
MLYDPRRMALRNVLVFALGGARYALELRWVREVVSVNAITPVPTAPAAIAGTMNFRGAIVPVIGPAALFAPNPPPDRARLPRVGDQAILVDVEGTRAAVPADRIDEVTTLHEAPREPGKGDAVVDAKGKAITLLDPPAILAEVLWRVTEAAERLAARLSGEKSDKASS